MPSPMSYEERRFSSPMLAPLLQSNSPPPLPGMPGMSQFGSIDGRCQSLDNLVPCPSCRGLGRVPTEFQGQLVALIPMKDNRLKPRRTLRYVLITFALCSLTAGLLVFFLIPRDISITSSTDPILNTSVTINTTHNLVDIYFIHQFNLSNSNYVPVTVNGVLLSAKYFTSILGTARMYKLKPLTIKMRSDLVINVPINVKFAGDQGKSFAKRCLETSPWSYEPDIHFEVNVNYTLIDQTSQSSMTTHNRVSCRPMTTSTVWPETTAVVSAAPTL